MTVPHMQDMMRILAAGSERLGVHGHLGRRPL